jgi:hypothetical protein
MDLDPENLPAGFDPDKHPERPGDFDPSQIRGKGQHSDADRKLPPEGIDGNFPEGMEPPEIPEDGFNSPQQDTMSTGKPNTAFYMNDKVNFFSGISTA